MYRAELQLEADTLYTQQGIRAFSAIIKRLHRIAHPICVMVYHIGNYEDRHVWTIQGLCGGA